MIRLRKARLTAAIVLGVGVLVTPVAAVTGAASATLSSITGFFALPNSVPKTTDVLTGAYTSRSMQIEVAVAPRDEAGLNNLLDQLYTKGSAYYHKWLTQGQFDARFAPTPAAQSAVARYLTASGLTVVPSGSPFLVRATGSSSLVSNAFRTSLSTYRDPKGTTYFSNSTPVMLPDSLIGGTLGVIGLTNTIRDQSHSAPTEVPRFNNTMRPKGTKPAQGTGSGGSCQTGYPTTAQLVNMFVNGVTFPFGYGLGPACSGLSPSQTNGIYGAPSVGPKGQGKGVTLGLFELSLYRHSDITTWAQHWYGPGYTPPLVDRLVDGGPANNPGPPVTGPPGCPGGDTCPPEFNGYSGDIEVAADIEAQLSVAPAAKKLVVYNAPNDFTGQTELAEYTAIAKDDIADVVSSSWAVCENDATASYVQAENVVFEQMATQGQSMFGAEGDTGAFGCIRSDGTTIVNLLDPPAQPWVTSVGGTSMDGFNPGFNPNPTYPTTAVPAFGVEQVWNVDNLCSNAPASPANFYLTGFFWCATTGAGGGGSSQWWGMPSWQKGPGVINPFTTYGNGTTHCALAAVGTPCRAAPDVSMNADEFTPYAEFCTGNPNPPDFSNCGTFSGSQPVPGWFGIGGTSLSSPLWSAIIADRDSYLGKRSGNIGALIYGLYQTDPSAFFHDITGYLQTSNNNGLYPTKPGFDLATGIGTPKMGPIITGS